MTLRIWPWSALADSEQARVHAELQAAIWYDAAHKARSDNRKLSDALTTTNDEMATLRAQIAKFDGDGDGRIGGSKPRPAYNPDNPPPSVSSLTAKPNPKRERQG